MATSPIQPAPLAAPDLALRPANVNITYFAFCDIGEQAGSVADERLKALASAAQSSIVAAYDVATSVVHTRASSALGVANENQHLLRIYRDEMYTKRIAPFARTQ